MPQQDRIGLRVGFIGAGRVAKGLAWGLAQGGERVVAAASRNPASAAQLAARIAGCRAAATAQDVIDSSDLVFVTVPDDAIAAVADSLKWRKDLAVVHCSGATEVAALEYYRLIDGCVIDSVDEAAAEGIRACGIDVAVAPTIMRSDDDRAALAQVVLDLARAVRARKEAERSS